VKLTNSRRLLNLGCGNRFHKEWSNIDFNSSSEYVKAYNLLEGIPCPDNYFDVVYHNNVLEHFQQCDGKRLIQECFRVLKSHGIIRVVVPDLENIVRCYIENLEKAMMGDHEAEYNYDWIMLELYDQTVRNYSGGAMAEYLRQDNLTNEKFIFERCGNVVREIRESYLAEKKNKPIILRKRLKVIAKRILHRIVNENYAIGRFRRSGEVHQWMYDRYSLSRLLRNAGFSHIEIKEPFESDIPDWHFYQLDVKDGVVHSPQSLYMEAVKQ
jgi:predicted SAM-dependent methyltransferase